jgi:C4-dicarboxylate-specific signal transduction histidine kinase
MNDDFDDISDDELLGIGSHNDTHTAAKIHLLSIADEQTTISLLNACDNHSPGLSIVHKTHSTFNNQVTDNIGFAVIEVRITNAFDDLKNIKLTRTQRPMLPIIALTNNKDKDFITELFKAGATDYASLDIDAQSLTEKVNSLFKMSEAGRMVEIQNEELVNSMKSLRKEIQDRKLAEADKADTREQLAEATKLASLGEMAGSIAHEINTPLAVIVGSSSMLKDSLNEKDVDLDECREVAEEIEKMSDRINAIIRGLKTLSRQGEQDPMETVKVSDIVNDTFALCEEQIERLGIKIEIEDFPADLTIACQPTQISQILINTINNSRHAVETESEKWIKIEIESDNDYVTFSIRDSGQGISKELQDKIMEAYFTTKEKGVGTGLGLSVSQKIAKAHGGNFWLDKECENTRFRWSIHRVAPDTAKAS